MEDDIKSRTLAFIKYKGITMKSFETQCNLSTGYVTSMRKGFGREKLNNVLTAFPELNRDWLLYGEGEMIKNSLDNGRKYRIDEIEIPSLEEIERVKNSPYWVPLINIDSVGGVWSENAVTSSEQYIERLIPFEGAHPDDVAIYQSGNSMTPTIPPGSVMQLRKVEGWQEYFGYGDVYVLWLKDGRRITKLVKCYTPDSDNFVLCCSYNPEAADEKLPRSFIREVWKVINVLIPKGW